MTRRHNPLRVHAHRCYTIPELSILLRVTKGTISRWIRLGLEPIEWKRPYLFKGWVVADFLRALNRPHRPLGPGEVQCVVCKVAVRPVHGTVRIVPRLATNVDAWGHCPRCGHRVFRTIRVSELLEKLGDLKIADADVTAPVSSSSHRPYIEYSVGLEP